MFSCGFNSSLFQMTRYQNLTLVLYLINQLNYKENILMIEIEYFPH